MNEFFSERKFIKQNIGIEFDLRQNFGLSAFRADLPPLLFLPPSLSNISFEKSRLIIPLPETKGAKKQPKLKKPTDTVYLPEVDPILTSYANGYMAIQFTLRFIKYVQNPANRSKGKVLTSDKTHLQETMAFYKDNPENIASLELWLKTYTDKIVQQLKLVEYIYKDKRFHLNEDDARRFIKRVNESLEINQFKDFFGKIKSVVYEQTGFKEVVITAESVIGDPRVRALLDVLVFSEGTGAGYGTIVRGVVLAAPFNPDLVGKTNVVITDFSKHPQILVSVTGTGLKSTAAGRYQFKYDTWKRFGGDAVDFSQRSQDLLAVKAMIYRGMIDLLLSGKIKEAINAGAPEWASLPMSNGQSYYKQPVKSMADLLSIYNQALSNYQK
jgi:muramidase (phage lysozyme)